MNTITRRTGGWVAAAVAILLVPGLWAATYFLPQRLVISFPVKFPIFAAMLGLAIWASVVAALRLSRWWYILTAFWSLVFLAYSLAAVAY